jgi:IS30 family transposase
VQRSQISALKDTAHTQRDIAGVIESNQSTISRELASNTGIRGYWHIRRRIERYSIVKMLLNIKNKESVSHQRGRKEERKKGIINHIFSKNGHVW